MITACLGSVTFVNVTDREECGGVAARKIEVLFDAEPYNADFRT